jgi:hypothetical protein
VHGERPDDGGILPGTQIRAGTVVLYYQYPEH